MKGIILIIASILFASDIQAQVPRDLYGTWEITSIDGNRNTSDYRKFKFTPIRDAFISLTHPKFINEDITLQFHGIFTCADNNKDELQGFYDFYGRNAFILYTFYKEKLQISIVNIKEWSSTNIVAEFDISEYRGNANTKSTRVLERRNDDFYPSYRIDLWVEQTESASLAKRELNVRPPGPIRSYTMFDKENSNFIEIIDNTQEKESRKNLRDEIWKELSGKVNILKTIFKPESNFRFEQSEDDPYEIKVSNLKFGNALSASFKDFEIIGNYISNNTKKNGKSISIIYDNEINTIHEGKAPLKLFYFITEEGTEIPYYYFSDFTLITNTGDLLFDGSSKDEKIAIVTSSTTFKNFQEQLTGSNKISFRYLVGVNYYQNKFDVIDLQTGKFIYRRVETSYLDENIKALFKKKR